MGGQLKGIMIMSDVTKLSPQSFQFQCMDLVKVISISLCCATIANSSHNALQSGWRKKMKTTRAAEQLPSPREKKECFRDPA